MIYIFVVLLLNNHILVHHSNNEDNPDMPNLVEILEEFTTNDIMDVDKTVKKYMLSHGIDKVRGGSYKNEVLEEWQIKSLEHELKLLKPNNDENKLKLDVFVNSYNNSNIDDTINHIIHFRMRLLKLKQMDRATNINMNVDEIISIIKKNDKLEELKKEFQKYSNQRNVDSLTRNKMIKMEQYINKLNQDIYELNQDRRYNADIILSELQHIYHNYLIYTDNTQSIENDIIVKLYSTKIFNTEIKQQIKDFKSPFGSTEEEILEKYQALLKRKLSLIQTN